MVEPHHQSTEKEEDRISDLQDCLLIEIISRLPTTKEAIRTGTLSKRWQHLWPFVSNLFFVDCKDYFQFDKFVLLVDKTLTQCRQLNLHKFQIRAYYNDQFESQVNNWIRFAVTRNVQDLDLSLTAKFVLDEFMLINSCFTHLKLGGCVLNPTGAISWTKLTSLSIFYVELSQDLIQNILSGCPLLETFELAYCHGFRRVDITSKSVKNFLFSGYDDNEVEVVIEISAPYIVSLTITDVLWLWKLFLVDVSCLVKAHLNYETSGHYEPTREVRHEETLKGLILSLSHVKELKIGALCLQVLSRLEAKGFIFPSNLKVVDVTSHLSNDTHGDAIELADTYHSNSNESGDSEGIVEQVLGTCCAHNWGQGTKLAGGASTTCAQLQESMYTQKQVDAMFEAQNKMIATQHRMITTQHRMIEAQSLQFSTLVRALIKSGFPVPDSIVPENVNEGNEEKDGEDENDK